MSERREEVLRILRELKPALQAKYGLERIGLFGSLARGDDGPESDVDVVVDIRFERVADYFDMLEQIEIALGGRVDIVRLSPDLRPVLRERVTRDAYFV